MPRLAIALLLVLTACSPGVTAEVRPFSEIADGEPQISFDASGTVATLTIRTTVDAVCAVVYGEDEPSGGIATDRDMGGGAHSDHQAVMTGLRPETTYQYRLQGVAA
ncbi:MAG: fibronectin type III domain-containing protein, partial [Acidimicrobiia bacterium]